MIHQRFHGVERILIFRFIHPKTRHIRVCRTERHQIVDVEQYHTVIAEIIRNAERLAEGKRRLNTPRCQAALFVSTQLTKPEQSKEVDGLLPPHT